MSNSFLQTITAKSRENSNGLDQRLGTVCYVPCITVTGWIRGQVLSAMYRA